MSCCAGKDGSIAVNAFVPVTMFGSIALIVFLFKTRTAQEAVAIAVIGGFLLLPAASYDFPLLSNYTKTTSIAIGLILGGTLSGQSSRYPFRFCPLDIPVAVLCFISPMVTSLVNGLGAYNGFADVVASTLNWGTYYWAGRKYFSEPSMIRILTKGIAFGGLLYFPAILFEVRMSPQLSNMIYGFFPHSFLQHFRYGGYRPIVFLSHGLMVALWMAAATTVIYWLWRSKIVRNFGVVPLSLASLAMVGAVVLCKSANGWFFTALGIASFAYYNKTGSTLAFRLLFVLIPVYMAVRVSNLIPISTVQSLAGHLFDAERIESLTWRLLQEDLFGAHGLRRPWFGWGGFGRNWPVDPLTGEHLIQMVDSLWVILFSGSGFIGLGSAYLSLGLGPWKVLRYLGRAQEPDMAEDLASRSFDAIMISLVVCFFLLDSLLNAMVSPIYILCSGALTTFYLVSSQPVEDAVPESRLMGT